jgi:hypothetical protein
MTTSLSIARVALLCVVAVAPAAAQAPAPDATAPAAATPAAAGGRTIEYGVRFGPAFTTLSSVETFDATVAAAAREPTMNFGGFITINLPGPLALQPEVLFAAKGHRIHDKDARPTVTGTGVTPPKADRVILLRYLEIPLLLRASKQTASDSSMYLIAGPALAIRRGAVIREVRDPGKLEDISDLVSGNNMSIVFGGGFQHERWLVDARVTKGLRNVAVAPDPSVVKTGAFTVLLGVRL